MCVKHEETTLANKEMIHRMSYKIYDSEGDLVESGIMPISKEEAQLRLDYGSRTLVNGQTMVLDNNGSMFIVPSGAYITMAFGLNRNTTVFAGIYCSNQGRYLNSWTGFTGGHQLNIK